VARNDKLTRVARDGTEIVTREEFLSKSLLDVKTVFQGELRHYNVGTKQR
jgi:hypothetical protein